MPNVTKDLEEILKDYIDEVGEKSDKVLKSAASDTAKDLRSTSPKRTGRYASSWAVKTENGVGGTKTYIVHNKKYGWKTTLLENGHATRNGTGRVFPDTPAHPHIKAAEDRAASKIVAEMESEL